MRIGALLGWGICIYAVVYLVWSGLVIHGYAGTIITQLVVLATLVASTTIATRNLGYRAERDILPYAIGWMLIVIALDAVFAVPFSGWSLYADWNMWVGYLLVLGVPLVVTAFRRPKVTVA